MEGHDGQAAPLSDLHVVVGAGGLTGQAKDRVAVRQQALRRLL